MNCESCKVEIAAQSAIGGKCARCAAKAPAPKAVTEELHGIPGGLAEVTDPVRIAAFNAKTAEKGGFNDDGTAKPATISHYKNEPEKTEPAHLGHAHTRSEPADHSKKHR
jgi:hypothetical protein